MFLSSTQKYGSPAAQFNNSYNMNGQRFLAPTVNFSLWTVLKASSWQGSPIYVLWSSHPWPQESFHISLMSVMVLASPELIFKYKCLKQHGRKFLSSVAIQLGRCESLEKVHIQGTTLTSWRRKGKRVLVKRFITISHATRWSIFWHQHEVHPSHLQ